MTLIQRYMRWLDKDQDNAMALLGKSLLHWAIGVSLAGAALLAIFKLISLIL